MTGLGALSCVLACDPCKENKEKVVEEGVVVDGFELYDLHHSNTDGSIKIVREDDGAIRLLTFDTDETVQERSRAKLTEAALDVLNDTVAQLQAGAELGGFSGTCLGTVDAPISRLSVFVSQASLQFAYPLQCAPPLLAGLDEMYRDIAVSMATCADSPWLQDCQLLE